MIRLARAEDAAAIAALWNPWIRDSAITFTTAEKTAGDVEEMIATRPAVFVAEDLSGFATYGQFRSGPGYATCMEHTIILSPAARGQGVGRALMQAVEDHARDHGAHQMIGGISAENPAALAFHARLGYAEIARITEAGFKFGRYIDLVLMRKFLGPAG